MALKNPPQNAAEVAANAANIADNTSNIRPLATTAEAEAGLLDSKSMSPLKTAAAIAGLTGDSSGAAVAVSLGVHIAATTDYQTFAKVYGMGALSGILSRLDSEKIDFVAIGDSNQLLGGYGWDHGFQFALSQYYPMYATALISANESGGGGGGQGYGYRYSAGTDVGAASGAPAELEKYLDTGLASNTVAMYAYLSDAESVSADFTGMAILADSPLDVNASLKFRFHYGTFLAGTSNINLQVRIGESPYTTLAQQVIDPVTGAYGMTSQDVDIAASTRDKIIAAYWMFSGQTLEGPSFFTYQHAINTDRAAGFAYSTLIAHGGGSLYDLSYDLSEWSAESLAHYFGIIRDRQGASKHVVIVLNSGLNDRLETETSRGQLAITDGDSSLAFLDNAENIIKQLRQVWGANGWDRDELTFVLMVSHPVSDPDDAELVSYRNAIIQLCDSYENICAINLDNLTDETEMLANGWYASGGADRNHLSQAGYEQIGLKIIDTVR